MTPAETNGKGSGIKTHLRTSIKFVVLTSWRLFMLSAHICVWLRPVGLPHVVLRSVAADRWEGNGGMLAATERNASSST